VVALFNTASERLPKATRQGQALLCLAMQPFYLWQIKRIVSIGQFWHDACRIMKAVHTQLLADDELRQQLEARQSIDFSGSEIDWHEIERQVERLGYGDLYIVSATHGSPATSPRIQLRPI
jgi:hypothetical protein